MRSSGGTAVGSIQSQGVDMPAGVTEVPASEYPVPDYMDAQLGEVPVAPHGSSNGTDCLSCHGSASFSNPIPQNHAAAALTSEHCVLCHTV